MAVVERWLDYEQSLLFLGPSKKNARDMQMTTRGSGYASLFSFFFSGCRPRFSRLAASPLNASARTLPLLNLKKKRDCSQSKRWPF